MSNNDIRKAAQRVGVFLWEIAGELGISDGNFSRKLRKELPDTEKEKILSIIKSLADKKRTGE